MRKLAFPLAFCFALLPTPANAVIVTNTTGGAVSTYTVPAGVTRIQIEAKGADGGLATGSANSPGGGATVVGVFDVTPGTVISYVVGDAGASGDFEAGGGGGTGVFIGNTLVMVAGGGGGEDNTGNGGVGQSGTSGTAGLTATNGGTAGAGGNGGGGGNNGGAISPFGDGGGGGGGINSAGGDVNHPSPPEPGAPKTTTGGGIADTNIADGLTISPGGVSTQTIDTAGADNIGTAGGAGFGGGGAGSHRESGGGGGYSGGGGGGSGGAPGGGGSYLNTAAVGYVSGSTTAGTAGTGIDGSVRISYTTLQLRKTSVNNFGTFSFSSPQMTASPVSITTTAPSTPVSAAVIPLNVVGATVVITEAAMPANWAFTARNCTGLGGGTAVANFAARTLTLNATATAAGNDIVCTFTNTYTLTGTNLNISKTASVASVSTIGSVITYTIVATNTGTTNITNLQISDPILGGTGVIPSASCTPGGNPATLNSGNTRTCTFNYTVPFSVFDNNGGGDGDIDNTVTASGNAGALVRTASATVNLVVSPTLTLTKSYTFTTDTAPLGVANVGDVIQYEYVVANTGNTTITALSVEDIHEGSALAAGVVADETLTIAGSIAGSVDDATPNNGVWGTIRAGATVRFRYNHNVTQAEVNGG